MDGSCVYHDILMACREKRLSFYHLSATHSSIICRTPNFAQPVKLGPSADWYKGRSFSLIQEKQKPHFRSLFKSEGQRLVSHRGHTHSDTDVGNTVNFKINS